MQKGSQDVLPLTASSRSNSTAHLTVLRSHYYCCRIPWDMESSMGQDNNLGGSPGNLYCILACEQWNSPLYCDSEHPQVRPPCCTGSPLALMLVWSTPKTTDGSKPPQ